MRPSRRLPPSGCLGRAPGSVTRPEDCSAWPVRRSRGICGRARPSAVSRSSGPSSARLRPTTRCSSAGGPDACVPRPSQNPSRRSGAAAVPMPPRERPSSPTVQTWPSRSSTTSVTSGSGPVPFCAGSTMRAGVGLPGGSDRREREDRRDLSGERADAGPPPGAVPGRHGRAGGRRLGPPRAVLVVRRIVHRSSREAAIRRGRSPRAEPTTANPMDS